MVQLYDTLNRGWKSAARILFGEELGELKEYEVWLKEYLPPVSRRKSHVSGKDVALAMDAYCPTARFVSLDEVKEKSVEPLSINDVKDIDSIVEAVAEKWEYTGNRVLGNSNFVEASDLVIDSQYVMDSVDVSQSAYVFASSMVRKGSKYAYGSGYFGQGEFIVRSFAAFNVQRMLESHLIGDCSDMYFSYSCYGCNDVMFSFFQRNKRHCIGNLALPKEKYAALKRKLLAEVAEELRKNKRFPSPIEMVRERKTPVPSISLRTEKEKTDMAPIERSFSQTFKVIFKKDVHGIENYENFLSRHVAPLREVDTPFGHKTYVAESARFPVFLKLPKTRTVSFEEGIELGKRAIGEGDMASLDKIREGLGSIAYFTAEYINGVNTNIIKTPLVYHAAHSYKTYDATHSEYTGVNTMALNSKYAFGCFRILESQFCISCYNSLGLSRCFNVDTSSKCADAYFCHNCEGLTDCMFCFNAKGKRHAIGNAQLAPDAYKKIKDALLEQIGSELERKKDLKLDIYNIGCAKP